MNGSGCKTCPVKPCHTLHYRGSYCAEQRAKHGLGDPLTNAEWIRGMTEKELAEFIGHNSLCDRVQGEAGNWCNDHNCTDCLEEWLKQPAEVDNGQSNDQK